MSEQIFSFDCFIKNAKNEADTSNNIFRVYYIKLMLMALLPVLLFIACYTVWGIYSWRVKDYSNIRSRAISSLVILLFLFHPNIV